MSTGTGSSTSAGPNLSRISQPVLTRQDSKGGVDSRFCCNICLDAVVDPVATYCGHLYCWPCLFRWLEPGLYPEERASLGIMQHSLTSDTNRRVCPVCKASCSVPTLVPIYVRGSNDTESVTSTNHESTLFLQQQSVTPDDILAGTSVTDQSDPLHNGPDRGGTHNMDMAHPTTEQPISADSVPITGLRQRIRFRSQDSDNSTENVPSRPSAQSPRHHHSPSSPSSTSPTHQRYGTNSWVTTPLTPTGRRGSLTDSLLMSIQQATAGNSGVPPLHRRDGLHPNDFLDAQSGATEYLSRLLLMLACFVVLCLLLL